MGSNAELGHFTHPQKGVWIPIAIRDAQRPFFSGAQRPFGDAQRPFFLRIYMLKIDYLPAALAWSSKNVARPESVNGCFNKPKMAESGQVTTSAPN